MSVALFHAASSARAAQTQVVRLHRKGYGVMAIVELSGFVIPDNLRVHHSKPVKAWVAERTDRIELFYLPSYSPALNPEERLNADLKHVIGTKTPARTKVKLRAIACEPRQALEQAPEHVEKYFHDSRLKYAA